MPEFTKGGQQANPLFITSSWPCRDSSTGGTQVVLEPNCQEAETLLLVTVLKHPLLSVGEIKNALQLYRQERTSRQGNQAA